MITATGLELRAGARLLLEAPQLRIQAGGRELSVVDRPGHSGTDTLFVDAAHRLAFGGDHLLAKISPNTEIYQAAGGGRSRSRVDYINGVKR